MMYIIITILQFQKLYLFPYNIGITKKISILLIVINYNALGSSIAYFIFVIKKSINLGSKHDKYNIVFAVE